MISSPYHSIVLNQKLVSLQAPIVMGIINLSPDSFYVSSVAKAQTNLLKKVEKHGIEGALIVDIGAMSSRPGSQFISSEDEFAIYKQFLPLAIKEFPNVFFSIDTHRSKIAKYCLDQGAAMINDITAGLGDETMFDVIAEFQVPYILMHMQKSPDVMQDKPDYKNVVLEVLDFLIQRVGELRERGVHDIIIDPGFGFGKTIEHNYQLLKGLSDFRILDCPILAGISRKSMIYKTLEITPEMALNGTSALHMLALMNKANILRVHDVKEAMEVVKLYELIKSV